MMVALIDFPEISLADEQWLDLEVFKQMDYYAIEQYGLPIELMMENAGLNLATLVSQCCNKDADLMGLKLKLGDIYKHFDGKAFSHPKYNEFIAQQVDKFITF